MSKYAVTRIMVEHTDHIQHVPFPDDRIWRLIQQNFIPPSPTIPLAVMVFTWELVESGSSVPTREPSHEG